MMDHTSDPSERSQPGDSPFTPFALLGAVAMTAGLTAYLAWPTSRSVSARQRQALVAYLHDHLSGSDMAVQVVHRLGSTLQATQDQTLFRRLSKEFEDERAVIRTLLKQFGASGRSIKRAATVASGTVLSATAGGEPGDLSLLRTFEALAIGIQGKRCLWRGLQNLDTLPLTLDDVTFVELEVRAVRQWEAIEDRRLALVAQTFSLASCGS